MTRIKARWTPNMEQRAASRDARQVKCLIPSEGHLWMRDYFDRLPARVRRRLADGCYNICPACLTEEAQRMALAQGLKCPTNNIYFAVIVAIERILADDDPMPEQARKN